MNYKVLIVDDSKLARMAVSKALRALHPAWPRLEAANVEDALRCLKESGPDIALVDFNMPGRDGLDLAAELRQSNPHMPVAVISANHQQVILDRARAAGAAFLPKPLTAEALGEFLNAAVQALPKAARERVVAGRPGQLELDALTELVNLGISNAATSLAAMVREEVTLSVPNVALVSRETAIRTLGEREASKLVAVHQLFEGEITGRALLIFPEAKSLELVRAVVGGELSFDEMIELEQEALAETGNVILNGCLATIANQLQRSLKISLPEILYGESHHFFNLDPPPAPGDVVMLIYINFAVRHRDINGYIAMLLDMPSIAALKTLLGGYISRVAEE